MFFHLYKSF